MKPVVIAIPETGNSLYQKYLKGKYVRSLQRADAAARMIDLTDPESAGQRSSGLRWLIACRRSRHRSCLIWQAKDSKMRKTRSGAGSG